MSNKLYRIPLEKLVLDNSLKVRAINEDHIERLSNSDPSLWPVLKVVPEDGGNKYYVVSGWHRVNAAREMGLNALDCELVEYIDDDNAKLLAYESNGSHGLPLTVTERKKYASLLREQYPYMQVKDIAKKVNLAPSTVSEHLR